MRAFFFVTLILVTAASDIFASEIADCNLRINSYNDQHGKTFYWFECEISFNNDIVYQNVIVEKVNYRKDNLPAEKPAKVISIWIRSKIMYYLPKFLILEEIENLSIIRTGLTQIKSYDISRFTNLRNLDLSENSLEKLEEDLFKHNVNLVAINLSRNRIRFIHQNVFNLLKALNSLNLEQNMCIGQKAVGQFNVQNFLTIVMQKCFMVVNDRTLLMIDNNFKKIENVQNSVAGLESKVNSNKQTLETKFRNEILSLKTLLQKQIDDVKNEINSSTDKVIHEISSHDSNSTQTIVAKCEQLSGLSIEDKIILICTFSVSCVSLIAFCCWFGLKSNKNAKSEEKDHIKTTEEKLEKESNATSTKMAEFEADTYEEIPAKSFSYEIDDYAEVQNDLPLYAIVDRTKKSKK